MKQFEGDKELRCPDATIRVISEIAGRREKELSEIRDRLERQQYNPETMQLMRRHVGLEDDPRLEELQLADEHLLPKGERARIEAEQKKRDEREAKRAKREAVRAQEAPPSTPYAFEMGYRGQPKPEQIARVYKLEDGSVLCRDSEGYPFAEYSGDADEVRKKIQGAPSNAKFFIIERTRTELTREEFFKSVVTTPHIGHKAPDLTR